MSTPETTTAPEWLPSSDTFKKLLAPCYDPIFGKSPRDAFDAAEVETELARARACIIELRARLAAAPVRSVRKPEEVFEALLIEAQRGDQFPRHLIELLRDELQASIVLAFLRGHS